MKSIFRNLSDTPDKAVGFYWADYAEICCIASKDRSLSKHDLVRTMDTTEDINADAETVEVNDGEPHDPLIVKKRHGASKRDKYERHANDIFMHLKGRETMFGAHYPFALNSKSGELELAKKLSEAQWLYLALLLCSNLRYFLKSKAALTSGFEVIAFHALKALLPDSEVRLVGTTHKGRSGHLATKTQKKIDKLQAISDAVKSALLAQEEEFADEDTGDAGVDIIAWMELDRTGISRDFVIFGQCACSKEEWIKKQSESSYSNWSKIIRLAAANINMMFVPFTPRKENGAWERGQIRSGEAIWIDRLRIIQKLAKKDGSVMFSGSVLTPEVADFTKKVLASA